MVPPNFPVYWRKSTGELNTLSLNFTYTNPVNGAAVAAPSQAADLSGGFYTGGAVGPVKITTHVAWTTSMLAWSLLEFEDWCAIYIFI